MTIQLKKPKINLREKLAELLNFNEIRDSLSGLGLFLGKDRTNNARNISIRGGADIDDLHIAEISAALGGTAVDVFVYDTRKDSDGGAWRERTSHTSWYNEELNTATRGSRREFPAVAVIVAETNKVTIYDGDDPDLSMWMVFNSGGLSFSNRAFISRLDDSITSVAMLCGVLCVGVNLSSGGVNTVGFVEDKMIRYSTIASYGEDRDFINNRNDIISTAPTSTNAIINGQVNDVAMTVLPNAPIDDNTGLPIPTIAVATNVGVSVIKDDGSVVDITLSDSVYNYSHNVDFDLLNVLSIGFGHPSQTSYGYLYKYNDIPSSDTVITTNTKTATGAAPNYFATANYNVSFSNVNTHLIGQGVFNVPVIDISKNAIASTKGLNLLYGDNTISHVTSSYNTGWMPGDIKLAALSDTKIEKVGVDESTELIGSATYQDSTRLTSYIYNDGDARVIINDDESSLNGYVKLRLNGLIVGKKYKIEMQGNASYAPSAADYNNKIADADVVVAELDSSKQGTTDLNSLEFTASSENYLYLYGGDLTYTLSLKQTGELITNGTFDNGTVGWTLGTGWTIGDGVASIANSGSNIFLEQTINVEAGKIYAFEAEVTSYTSGIFGISWINGTTSLSSQNSITISRTSEGQLLRYMRAAASGTVKISVYVGSDSTGSVDNVSFREVELDRSVNNKGLKIFGEIDKTPVAPGADLVAYSGFTNGYYGVDRLEQPYNSDLAFGAGDFCISFWVKNLTDGSDMMGVGKRTVDAAWTLYKDAAGGIRFTASWDGTSYATMVEAQMGDGSTLLNWTNVAVTRSSGVFNIYVDGTLRHSNNAYTTQSFYATTAPLVIGSGNTSNTVSTGLSFSLLRISKTAPTAAQIAKIYRDEKVLFQDGAQATLYGTSDAVTALAYDDKTELLHVGTSSGRSDFAGLRRINNTTTAITTSISASNNLIAEQ